MVILINTEHEAYHLILLYNRVETFDRPTAPAAWWGSPYDNILGGRDLDPPEAQRGTWLGITRDGLFAALTNYVYPRKQSGDRDRISLGVAPRDFMANHAGVSQCPVGRRLRELTERNMLIGLDRYSMFCGPLHVGNDNLESIAAISNSYQMQDSSLLSMTTRFGTTKSESVGLAYTTPTTPWPVITFGQALLSAVIRDTETANDDQETMINKLFDLLNTNSITSTAHVSSKDLKHSIFIPPFAVNHSEKQLEARSLDDGIRAYDHSHSEGSIHDHYSLQSDKTIHYIGTRQQTIILVSNGGKVTYVERTLYLASEPTVVRPEPFHISGWGTERHNWQSGN